MNRTYEDMSKKELVTLVKRLTKQHDEWSAEAKRLREQLVEAKDWVWIEGGHRYETSEDRLKQYKEYIGHDEDYIEGVKKGILMGYCLGCSLAYPLEDMNKHGLCEECQGGEEE